jgi:hypothetical protein
VHQGGRVERLAGPLAAHLRASDPTQLLVDERQERIECGTVAASCRGEQARDAGGRRVGHAAIVAEAPGIGKRALTSDTPPTRRL